MFGSARAGAVASAAAAVKSVWIEARDVGRLIGRGGSNIRKLEESSTSSSGRGVRIKILDRNDVGRGPGSSSSTSMSSASSGKVQVQVSADDVVDSGSVEDCCRRIEEFLADRGGGGGGTRTPADDSIRNGAAVSGPPVGQARPDAPEPEDEEDVDWGALADRSRQELEAKVAELPELRKDFYRQHPDVANMTDEDVERFRRENNNISVSEEFGGTGIQPAALNPVRTFEEAFWRFPEIMETIGNQGFDRPSPIQSQMWPYLLSGRDVIGVAQTGTGKTLAFLMPAFIHIDGQPQNPAAAGKGAKERRKGVGGPSVLILCPVRELALQIADEVRKYSFKGIKSACLYGGGDRREQMTAVASDGVEIVIATPGRLNDLVQAGKVCVDNVGYVVLDEADRMLDMGFEPQIRKILLFVRPDRQTVMTSATWPDGSVRRLALSYMTAPVATVHVGSLDLAATHTVTQVVRVVDDRGAREADDCVEERKMGILMDFLRSMAPEDKVIVFVGKKAKASNLTCELAVSRFPVDSIHGDREQSDREQSLQWLRDGEIRILVATDVASRGLDIQDVTHVFNYDFPRNIEEYVHRVGRTGRFGKTGTSITLVEPRDRKNARELVRILEEAGQHVPRDLVRLAERYENWKSKCDEEKRLYGSCGPSGFGGDRRSGGGSGCYFCGEPGHFSRECPKKGY